MRILLLALILLALGGTARAEPAFVGSKVCAGCHAAETEAWTGSHHDLAMQPATAATVLGDFSGATFAYNGVTSRFFTRDGGYWVTTDGPDGRLGDHEIRYTFGVWPLQQYLVAMPGGRLQALGIAWDARPAAEGGQRWFHLYPGQAVHAGETIHWTGRDQTWNYVCAECHSTGLVKGYDPATDSYATSWAEIDVACEACHGPGAAHVAWAGAGGKGADDGLTVRFHDRRDVTWSLDDATGNAVRSRPRTSVVEIETCGMCHSRRTPIHAPWQPGRQLLDSHLTNLLEPGLFEADGKMIGEVFNYQAFRQSRMFARGVTCSDCHDPHSTRLVLEGNALCGQCHDPAKYDAAQHHHHADGSAGASCVACHMPARTYMEIDVRHDHGFRIPRPDQHAAFGTTDTCTDCHKDRDPAWAAAAIAGWHGPDRKGFQTWTPAFAAARKGEPGAGPALAAVATAAGTPAIARASALAQLGPYLSEATLPALQQGVADPDPLVRVGALRSLAGLPPELRWSVANGLLGDPVRAVRIEAASALADMPADRLATSDLARLDAAAAEYEAAQRLSFDRPEARVNLASFLAQRGRPAEAAPLFAGAIALWPDYVPAYVNLADLRAREGNDAEGERLLRTALQQAPGSAAAHHALGLNLIRQQRLGEAMPELRAATAQAPDDPRFAYVYAIALQETGDLAGALATLEAAHARNPADRDILVALVTYNRDAGDRTAARRWADILVALDPAARQLRDSLD
ncbi:MAG: tetratricopeptide repeat protein [Geminicoccaceae bacterium]